MIIDEVSMTVRITYGNFGKSSGTMTISLRALCRNEGMRDAETGYVKNRKSDVRKILGLLKRYTYEDVESDRIQKYLDEHSQTYGAMFRKA